MRWNTGVVRKRKSGGKYHMQVISKEGIALIKKFEKYNCEYILIIRKIQVNRDVKNNLETNSN